MDIGFIGKRCTGCKTCKVSCPKSAIDMLSSEDGFLYPQINREKCIDCGLCLKACPVLEGDKVQDLKKAYYGWAADKEIVMASSSGGIFSVLAQHILSENGIVFGAVFCPDSKRVCYKSTDEVDLDELRRSKYVEADTEGVFDKVKEQLELNRQVLFSGSPCHVAGLKSFLKKSYKNLLTCDFICGGVPAAKNLKEHLETLENKYKAKVIDINFRPKIFGWKEHSIRICFENGKQYRNYAYLDTFFRGFIYKHAIVRDSCAKCGFRTNHHSDIILADFWGFRQVKELDDKDTGISLVVSNSDKGTEIVERIIREKAAILKEIPLAYADYNFEEKDNTEPYAAAKKAFMTEYKKRGFEAAARKVYMKKCVRFRIKKYLKRFLKNIAEKR